MSEESKIDPVGTTVTLKDEDVFKVFVNPQERSYGEATSRKGEKFHITRFRGAGGTCSTDFYEAWSAGEISEVTLTKGEYVAQVMNAATGKPEPVTRASWTIDSYVSNEQLIKFLDGQEIIVQKRANLQAIKNGAMRKIEESKLTPEMAAAITT